MSSINYNIIDRIAAIKIELEQNTFNEIRVLVAIRNILFDVDEMTMNEIKIHLLTYYNINPSLVINSEIINYITQVGSTTNSINNLLSIWFNQPNSSFINGSSFGELETDSDNNSDIYSDSSSDDDSEEMPELEYTNSTSNFFSTLPNLSNLGNNTSYSNLGNNTSYSNFFNMQNTLNQPNLVNLSNLPNMSNQDNNLFSDTIYNMLHQSNTPVNNNQEDIPIVIKFYSLQKLKLKKYSKLDNEIKVKNRKCMITLEEFKDDDIVRILPCKHIFTKNNIDDWLLNSSYKCPICRKAAGEYYAKI